MYSITRHGETCLGTSVSGLGVFTDENGDTYAGQHKDGCACGLGVDSWATGKIYAEYGPDGEWDGRWLDRNADGDTVYYLFQRGEEKDSAFVYADGRCMYNGEACTPDDPRLLALTAQVLPVEALANAMATEAEEAVANLPLRLAGLELLVTVLLAQNRQPPPTDAAGVPHDEFVAELISLPSGLLAMVCKAIVKLKVSDLVL